MLSPVTSANANQASEAVKTSAPKPQPPQPQSSSQSADKVTLKSSGDVDHDGNSK